MAVFLGLWFGACGGQGGLWGNSTRYTRVCGIRACAAALRALEIGADAILMAKHGVQGVYDGDPREDPEASFLPRLTHLEAIERGLKVMDSTALSLCMDNRLTIHVFELADGNIARVVAGEDVGTVIETR